jgi:hypothetical protein
MEDLHFALASNPDVPKLELGQHWQSQPDPGLEQTFVRVAWAEDSLLVSATLHDVDIFNAARTLNERTWLLGDTFEMFFKDSETDHYVEFHVTPRNVRLQLIIPGEGLVSSAVQLWDPDLITSHAWREATPSCWFVTAKIPAKAVAMGQPSLAGRQWKFSFCRYDYFRGSPHPILSSSSPLSLPAFHRIGEWETMEFA